MEKKNVKSVSAILLLCAFGFTAFQVAGTILCYLGGFTDIAWWAESVLYAAICFIMAVSFRTHTKNVMKPAIGGALILLLYGELYEGFNVIQYFGEYLKAANNTGAVLGELIIVILALVAVIGLNIIHYSLNCTHHSTPRLVKTNRIFFVAYICLIVCKGLFGIISGNIYLMTIGTLLCTISDLFMVYIIIKIESTLDQFRVDREREADPDEPEVPVAKSKAGKYLAFSIAFVITYVASFLLLTLGARFSLSSLANVVVSSLIAFFIYVSYHEHTKNVMKPLLGAFIVLLLSEAREWAFYYISYFGELGEWYNNGAAMYTYAIAQIILFAIVILIFIIYIVVCSTHHSSPAKIKFIKVLGVGYLVCTSVQIISSLFIGGSSLIFISYLIEPLAGGIALWYFISLLKELDDHRIAREQKAE